MPYIAVYVKLHCRGQHIFEFIFWRSPSYIGMYFNCSGNETSLNNCQKSTTTCDFADVAGIYCTGDVITGTYMHACMMKSF